MSVPASLLGGLGAAGGVLMALIAHIVTYAYHRGQTDTRLETLERSNAAHAATDKLISALMATVEALKDSVDRLDNAVVEINRRIFKSRET